MSIIPPHMSNLQSTNVTQYNVISNKETPFVTLVHMVIYKTFDKIIALLCIKFTKMLHLLSAKPINHLKIPEYASIKG